MGPLSIPDEVLRSNPMIRPLWERKQQEAAAMTPVPEPMSHASAPPPAAQPEPQAPPLAPMQPAAQPRPLVKPPQPSENEQELQQKFNHVSTTGSGISQIHNPVGRTLLTIADAIGSGLFPRIAMNIPGTAAHHQQVLGETEHSLEHEQKNRQQTSAEQEQAARATELESRPELAQAKHDLESERIDEAARSHQATEDINRAKNEGTQTARESALEISARRAGYRHNAAGELEPIPYEEMTPAEQANYDLHSSQKELADATAQLRKAQAMKDPKSEELARMRLDIANRRLGLSQSTYNARYLGTDTQGNPLPGAMLTDENKPVGSVNAPNVRPTGTQRTRGNLAVSGLEQLNDMRSIVQKHPEYFGPGAGRATAFQKWIGSQDPEAQRFLTASEILADHAAGVFGARSEGTLAAQRIASGQLKDNPAAIIAALGQVEKAMKNIGEQGVVKTAGSRAATEATNPPAEQPKSEGGYKVGTRYGGLTYLGGPPSDEKSWKK
jgi:hypothetical protein